MNEENTPTGPTQEPAPTSNPTPPAPPAQPNSVDSEQNTAPPLEPSLGSLTSQPEFPEEVVAPDAVATGTPTPETPTPQSPNTVVTPSFSAQPAPRAPKKGHSRKKVLLILAIVLVIIGLAVGGYFVYAKSKDSAAKPATTTKTVTKKVTKDEKPTVPITGVQWLAEPEKIAYQPLFNEEKLTQFYYDSTVDQAKAQISFYKIGTERTKNVLAVQIPAYIGGGISYLTVVQDGTNYTILKKNSQSAYNESNGLYNGPELATGVATDESQAYTDLLVKDRVTVNGASLVKVGEWSIPNDTLKSTFIKEATVPEGTLYSNTQSHSSDNGIKFMSLYLKQPSGVYSLYRYATSILNDDKSAAITWKNGTTTTEAYQYGMVRGGCGIVDAVNVLDKTYANDLIEAGKTASGVTVYKLNAATHPVMNTVYGIYKRDDVKQDSQQTMYDTNGVIVVKNELGFNVILVNSKYQRAGECGKPVIYLYPQKTTKISVQVGANVTKSEPRYNNGWTVTAHPDGTLVTNGKTYENLFWEGTGTGIYPTVDRGFVVKQADVQATLIDHLARLGLNQKETNDFMEFWLPRMPKTPYARISWLTTREMNALAPLTLSKQPDTLIRVFVDFEGLTAPIQIQPQHLSHIPRTGFTVIEWGGLLRGGL